MKLKTRLCLVARVFLYIGFVSTVAVTAPAQVVKFPEPIAFHGGQLVGFEKATELNEFSRSFRPSQSGYLFLTVKLQIRAPFEYRRGMFREITLTDENGRIYQYKGFLVKEGWAAFDDSPSVRIGEAMLTVTGDTYPFDINIHFEVPSTVNSLVLKFADKTQVLFSPPN